MEKILTIVVAHYNYKDLRKTLESIRRNTPPIFNIVLVDQNTTYQQVDDLVDIHVYTKKQLGFAKAMNTGIRLSDTKYVAAWNDDCECINTKWWDGIVETFNRIPNAVGVNPSSPRNPGSPGGDCVEEWQYSSDMNDEEYDRLVKEHGKGWIIDGICTYATVFDKEKLDNVKGVVKGKSWYDEYFWPGGGEDYDLNRRAYISGYRMLGSGLSYVWHWWYGSNDGKVNFSYGFNDKWGDGADILGNNGPQDVPDNIVKKIEDCPSR